MSLSRLCSVAALLCLVSPALAQTTAAPQPTSAQPAAAQPAAQPAAAYLSDPQYIAAVREANLRTTTGQYGFAIDAYRKANKIAGGNCLDCLHNIAILQMRVHDDRGAIKTANELIARSTTPLGKSQAEALLAETILTRAGDKPKPDQLQAADQALKAALTDYPRNVSARFMEGEVLARLGDTDAARAAFKTCVAQCPPRIPTSSAPSALLTIPRSHTPKWLPRSPSPRSTELSSRWTK